MQRLIAVGLLSPSVLSLVNSQGTQPQRIFDTCDKTVCSPLVESSALMGAKVSFNLAGPCSHGKDPSGREIARLGYRDEEGALQYAEMTFTANPCGASDQCLPLPTSPEA